MNDRLNVLFLLTALGAMSGCADLDARSPRFFKDDPSFGEYTPTTHEVGEPISDGELKACESTPQCARSCSIDIANRQTDCDFDTDFRTAVIDMGNARRLHIRATLENPTGFAFHIGDSPSNNGHGGDGAEFSNDAEVHLVGGTKLLVYGNDYSLDDPNHIREFPDLLGEQGGELGLTLGDGMLSVRVDDAGFESQCVVEESHDLLRLDADDREGGPDRLWYLGLNQVYSGGREGTGLRRVELCFE